MKDLLRVSDLDKSEVLAILDRAEELRLGSKTTQVPENILGLLFFEPSTRTRFGFHAAMARIGGTAISLQETKFRAGMTDPESLEDTLRSIANYCDAFVLRHPDNDSIDRGAAILEVPLINGGNGTDEHPTQALIDLFAIRRALGCLEGLAVGIAGDLRDSRAAHSLLYALALFQPSELRVMYPSSRAPAPGLLEALAVPVTETEDGMEVEELDVLYMAGLPQGDGADALAQEVRARFRLTVESAQRLPRHAAVLSPLPCIDEIDRSVGELRIARYFRQSSDGLCVRMSVLEHVLTWANASNAGAGTAERRSYGP